MKLNHGVRDLVQDCLDRTDIGGSDEARLARATVYLFMAIAESLQEIADHLKPRGAGEHEGIDRLRGLLIPPPM